MDHLGGGMRLVLMMLIGGVSFCSALAIPANQVKCWASLLDARTGSWTSKVLKQSSFDDQYYRVEIGSYFYGTDYSFLTQNGVGLIILNDSSKVSNYSLQGFVGFDKDKQKVAETKIYHPQSGGKKDVAILKCISQDSLK